MINNLQKKKKKIVEVNLTTGNPVRIKEGDSFDFTYSVDWKESDIEFDNRFRRYLDFHFFEHKIHWFSIFNSFMMVLFLSGLVFMILMRTLRGDYAKYAKEIEDGYDTVCFCLLGSKTKAERNQKKKIFFNFLLLCSIY